MKSPSVVLKGRQAPTARHAPQTRQNAWEDVADIARAYGLVLDEWQENVLEAAMGERSDGMWASPRVGVAVPRQNGKGALIEARELAGLLVFGEQSIVHSAHEQKTARVGFDRIRSYFDNYDDLRRKVKAVGTAVAREYIELKSGQILRFPARSKGAIRGFSIDCLILDEAQEFSDLALQAVMPTLSARPNPQMWLLGTPPSPANEGEVFTRWRNAGLEGTDRRLCWCEWSAPVGSDLDDREAWATANPALGGRISYEAVADERAALDDQGFARERLGMWDSNAVSEVIPSADWAAIGDPAAAITGPISIGVDMSPDRTSAAVALAGETSDGRWLVALREHKTGPTDWVVPFVAAFKARNTVRAVVVDKMSAAASLEERFRLERIRLTVTGAAAQMAEACGEFYDGVYSGWLVHTAQPQLAYALSQARKRDLLSGGAWGWNKKSTESDITPVVAATLALWGARHSRKVHKMGTSSGGRVMVL